jgi:hypothetical protein
MSRCATDREPETSPIFRSATHQHAPTSRYYFRRQARFTSSAFGAKRTCRECRELVDLTTMTQSGHEWVAFAAMHGLALLYSP